MDLARSAVAASDSVEWSFLQCQPPDGCEGRLLDFPFQTQRGSQRPYLRFLGARQSCVDAEMKNRWCGCSSFRRRLALVGFEVEDFQSWSSMRAGNVFACASGLQQRPAIKCTDTHPELGPVCSSGTSQAPLLCQGHVSTGGRGVPAWGPGLEKQEKLFCIWKGRLQECDFFGPWLEGNVLHLS